MATGVQVNGDLIFDDAGQYPAVDFRKLLSNVPIGPGVCDYQSFLISLSAGATLNFGVGAAFVRQPGDGTLYRATQDGAAGQITLDSNAGNSNPRIDQVILHIYDGAAAGDTSNQFQALVEVINGAPTSGATLDNRLGAPNPRSVLTTGKAYIPLADVLWAASSSTISGANIRDRRPVAVEGVVPPLNADSSVNATSYQVCPIPSPALGIGRAKVTGDNFTSFSSAALFFNNAPIAATKLRWHYEQGGISGDGLSPIPSGNNWRFVICDASGRLVADTGSVAFAGSAGTIQQTNATLTVPYTGYIFDVGAMYAWFAVGAIANGLGCYYTGVQAGGIDGGDVAPGWLPPSSNQFVYLNSGGVTFDASNTIKNMHDLSGLGNAVYHLPVPLFTLAA